MTQDEQKKASAQAALDFIDYNDVIGVGTGSTVNFFIDALITIKHKVDGAVASSKATQQRLEQGGIRVLNLNQTGDLKLYIDGADEITVQGYMIKGGGAALTGEKIIAEASEQFICLVDESKKVGVLGQFPLPVEVIPMAQSLVARKLVKLGGLPELRVGVETAHGNVIIDVKNLDLVNPLAIEKAINQIPGVVTNGLFAIKPANIILVGSQDGVVRINC